MKFWGHFLSLLLHAPYNPRTLNWRQRFTHKPSAENAYLWNYLWYCFTLWCSCHGNWSSFWLSWSHCSHLTVGLLASKLIQNKQCMSACCSQDELGEKRQTQCWSDDPLFATATGKLFTHVPSRRWLTVKRKSAPSGRLWGRTPGRCVSRAVSSTCAAPAPHPA